MDTRALSRSYYQGQQAALAKFGADAPGLLSRIRGLATQQGLPTAAGLAGAGAGLMDLTRGRGVGGSMGTMIGTGGGGILGGWGGKALASRFGINPFIGQLAGTTAGALLGRAATRETPQQVAPYGQPY